MAKTYGRERDVAALMDDVGDELAARGLQAVLRDRKARHAHNSSYRLDDFKFNPYGIVVIDRPRGPVVS